jgi:hypothetical protein
MKKGVKERYYVEAEAAGGGSAALLAPRGKQWSVLDRSRADDEGHGRCVGTYDTRREARAACDKYNAEAREIEPMAITVRTRRPQWWPR